MSEKPKCPFCNAELRTNILDQPVIWYCPNHCIGSYEPKVWQALIDGKKAQDSLKEISRLNQYIRKELAHQIPEESSKADNSIYTITFEIAKECRKGLHNKIEDKSDGR